MTGHLPPALDTFPIATQTAWLREVEKALRGKGPDSLTRRTADGVPIRALYREPDIATGTLGLPGEEPFLRGKTAAPDPFLPWDIRQRFTHPSPAQTNAEILRDLERGVSSIELSIDPSGKDGVRISSAADLATALEGIDAQIACIALDHPCSDGTAAATLLEAWAAAQPDSAGLKLDFNLDPVATSGPDLEAMAVLVQRLGRDFPQAGLVRIDATQVHEAGGSEAQELAALIGGAIDTLRRLGPLADKISFALALDANFGMGIAKLRAARRLWSRCREALGLAPTPMKLQAISSARMLTRYDPWTNILRGTSAAFAGATGGADIITIRAFNEALGTPEELGRRIARNTQIIAMEESHLGRVADPAGGAWFTEALAEDLANAAWAEFQAIERDGGYAASLASGAFVARIAAIRVTRNEAIRKREMPLTGISEFPLLDEIPAPTALPRSLRELRFARHGLATVSLSSEFEDLRDRAAAAPKPLGIFLATLGTLAEFTPRADFARNFLAAGGIRALEPPILPETNTSLAAAFKASGARLVCLCASDTAYTNEAAEAVAALKDAGAEGIWIAGKHECAGIDGRIYMGCDAVAALTKMQAQLGLKA